MRLTADFDNYRRRSKEDLTEATASAAVRLTGDFLSLLDSFDLVAANIKTETEEEAKINKSYQGINKQFIKALEKLNVEPVEAQGKPFDSNLHAAIETQESIEYHDGIVITEFQRGYTIGGRLVRPTMCIVSSGPGPEKDRPQDHQ